MNLLRFLLLLAAPAIAFAQKTATVAINGDSVQLQPSTVQFVSGYGNVTAYFTTYNGNGSPLIGSGGVVSGELRPRVGAPGTYEGGYLVATTVATIDYGPYTVSIPTTDSDGDGTPDLIQFDKPGSFSSTGSGFSVPGNDPFSISFTFSRAANSAIGTYTAVSRNTTSTATYTGVYALLSYAGSVSYSRGSTNNLAFTITAQATGTVLTGSTTYTTTSNSSLSYAGFTVRDTLGNAYQVQPGTLTRSGTKYRGDLVLSDGLPQTSWADFTAYRITITDTNDSNGDGVPDLTDPTALPVVLAPPVITSSSTASSTFGTVFSYSITATNSPTSFNATGLPAGLSVNTGTGVISGTAIVAGAYTITVSASNTAGTGSATVNLVVAAVPQAAAPVITSASSAFSNLGAFFSYAITATNSPTSFNATPLPFGLSMNNITGVITGTTTAAGSYTFTVSANNAVGTGFATVNLVVSVSTTRLVNLSARAAVGTDSNILIAGFIISGSGNKSMLVRGVGPALLPLGVSNFLAQPSLGLFNGQSVQINSSTAWNNNAALSAAFNQVGAFGYAAGSADSALQVSLLANQTFTAEVSGVSNGTGVALAEIYDADPTLLTSPSRLVNISARANVGTGSNILIAGFIIGGSGNETVLVRGIGPTLGILGVAGVLGQPVLTVYDSSGKVITSDQGWQNPPTAPTGVWAGKASPTNASHATFSKVGAFDLSNGSADSALVITLPAGAYTAQISGANSTTGVALVEIYEDN